MKGKARVLLFIVLSAVAAAWPLISWATQDHGHAPPAGEHGKPKAIEQAPPHAAPTAGAHGEHGAAQHEPAGHGGEHAPGAINWADFSDSEHKPPPFLALVINIAVLLGLYYVLGKKPVAEALKNRRASVAKEIEEAQAMLKEAEQRAERYQAQLKNLKQEQETARQALIEAGKGERDRILREAEEAAARMRKDAEFVLQQELKQLRQDLLKETVDIAVGAAEELLRKRVTAADQERLAEEYLSDLGAQTRKAARAAASGGAS